MKRTILLPLFLSLFLSLTLTLPAQLIDPDYTFRASETYPWGRPHPDYEQQLSAFAPMIGDCTCKSVQRDQEGVWGDTVDMLWTFKYIMNGKAIQDESWKSDGGHSTSIRQYVPDSAWAVTFFSSSGPTFQPGVWAGGRDGDRVVLLQDYTAPNGMEGDSRLTFYNMDETGFDWIGEWVDKDRTIVYPFWKIYCDRIPLE